MLFPVFSLLSLSLASLGIAQPNMARPSPMPTSSMSPMSNQTTGHAVVINECTHAIYLWSVSSTMGSQITLAPQENYTEVFHHDDQSGGVSLKVTTVKDGLYNSAPQTVFAYNLVDRNVWYDLSDVFGDPFQGHLVTLLPSEPAINWEDGVPPAGSQVRIQDAATDLALTVC
ncbi:hypothetical protein EYZ11_002856 [Aspergillus tanneri]|uniref:Bys1 family protein n=1 Tax=Aspergillus tanneri TaxID=1220188 RepID=A0A4S3JPS3_9EURO|nr:uncharacterized protein ATNIH1004_008470 [Aspergillus tanneri]KAA8644271.1 hypothetical protein ATNIH1004_008470 [Aspergillus tanneri]THC97693.1 hypothetical protein EYZ11_002856 [Aspergillus tanneri]